ncbi:Putative NACHT nucleoside triphosphatase, P-loop containing nucleoside triphosphate hydrolase [Colletotrichum destructivum]|uniref:NACHT nucleoside triphosphatase, P-loop containing nucleoside triphosphate hydrolase n=1 Tax=Colletotrichum destructivum TaxID=34406 RepID=A0AAX4I518_9PEZI|nr:Putative NACHT nucleoside triphosphatase, P-loop containing nucleoside triphosphate hydrolase [Colletotrichum destructivum]
MKHGTTRDLIAKELSVLCFEMEAAGLMDKFPSLVIRGICDYADSHKTKEWQPYAAATAAAYAKELLSFVQAHVGQSTPTPPVSSVDGKSGTALLFVFERVLTNMFIDELETTQQQRLLLLASLEFENIGSRHEGIRRAHAKTCQWLLKHPDYTSWQNDEKFSDHHGFLWISGKPGAGKSTIMKFLVSQASRSPKAVVISFFFNARGDTLEKTVLGLYRSLLHQLLEQLPDLQEVLDGTRLPFLGKATSHTWKLDHLRSLFLDAIKRVKKRQVICFIDALDECPEDQVREMLDFFQELGQRAVLSKIRMHTCFSSRHYPHIGIKNGVRLTLEAQAGHAKDLEEYVRTKLENGDAESPKAIDIVKQILQKASGVFMWAVLVVEILNKEYQRGRIFAVQGRLDTIPAKLGDLFKDILTRDNENMDDLRLCIQWILFSRRPLKLKEYYFALASGLETDDALVWDSSQIPQKIMELFVLSSSKGLAETTATSKATNTDPTVQFIHESVRDFLLKDDGIRAIWPDAGPDFEAKSHERLKSCCFSYIKVAASHWLSNSLSAGTSLPKACSYEANDLRLLVGNMLPFLEYANSQLFSHAECAAAVMSKIRFLQEFRPIQAAWVVFFNLLEKYEVRRLHKKVSLLCILAIQNSSSLLRECLSLGIGAEEPTLRVSMEHYCTPLHAAVFKGSQEAAEVLVRYSAKNGGSLRKQAVRELHIDVVNKRGRTALSIAVEKEQSRVVRALLRRGADTTHKDRNGHTPFDMAIEKGHVPTAMPFFDPVDPAYSVCPQQYQRNSTELLKQTIALAVRLRQDKMLDALLKRGSELGVDLGGESSHFAEVVVREKVTSLLRIFLDNGAPVDDDLLCLAVRSCHKATVQTLLDADADLYRSGALHLAAESGDNTIVELLLQKGADVQGQDESGRSPLCMASARGHLRIAETLLGEGADINHADSHGRNPLWRSIHAGHPHVVQLLLDKGANVHCVYIKGCRPLHLAIRMMNSAQKSVQLLLEKGADVNCQQDNGMTALHLAAQRGEHSVVETLLRHGADPNLGYKHGKTALSEAINHAVESYPHHSQETILSLVRGGAELDTPSPEGLDIRAWALRLEKNHPGIGIHQSLLAVSEGSQSESVDIMAG